MADQIDTSSFFGDETAPKKNVEMAGQQKPGQINTEDFFSAKNKAPPPSTDPYEKQIESHIPEAEERSKNYGYTSAIATGAGEMLGVGPAVREVATDIGAAAGYGEGKDFSERRKDIKAQYEAQRRVSGEEYPKTQLAADVASQFAVPFVGEIAGPVTAGARALKVAPTAAKILGIGAESAALGAGSAAEEKLIGSKPEAEQADIGKSALISGGLGLGLGAVGAGVAKVAPEWMKTMMSPGRGALNTLSRSLAADEAAGASKIPMADLIKAVQEGQPVVAADMGGPEFQRALAKVAKNNPEAVTDLIEQMKGRLTEAGERFDTFAEKMSGVELNAAKLQDDARQQFEARNQAAWAPMKDPDLGRGTWLKQWNGLMNEPVFIQAVKNADANLANELGPNFKSAFMNTGDTLVDRLPLPDHMLSTLEDYGVKTFDDLRGIKPITLKSMFRVDPADNTAFAKAAAQRQTDQAVNQMKGIIGKLPPSKMVLADRNNMNMQYIDQIRRELDAIQNASFMGNASTQGGIGRRAQSIGEQFMGPIRDPKHPNYSRELDYAIKNSQDIFGEKDAFTGGLRLLDKDRNTLGKTNAFNATLNMSKAERDLAQQGVLASLLTKTRNPDGSLNTKMLQKYFDPNNYTAKAMQNIFGQGGYEKLERFVKTETMFRNSLANLAKSAGRSDPSLYYKLRDLRLVPTFLLSQPLALAQYAYGIADHFMGKRYAKALADKLASPDIEQFRDAQLMLQNNPRLLSAMAQNMIRLSANVPGAYPEVTRAEGGRVGYNGGGSVNRINMSHKDVVKRVPELTEGARQLSQGNITKQDYDALVNTHKPIMPYESVPRPATHDEMFNALKSDQRPFLGKTKDIPEGTPVGNRLDIPAYKDHGVWIPTTHEQQAGFSAGPKLGHDSVSHVVDATLGVHEPAAMKYAKGDTNKATFATIKGNHVPITPEEAHSMAEEALNHPEWAQVGMDPERHSYFYDRKTTQPIVAAKRVLQVGPLVLAHKPVYGKKEDFSFNEGGYVGHTNWPVHPALKIHGMHVGSNVTFTGRR